MSVHILYVWLQNLHVQVPCTLYTMHILYNMRTIVYTIVVRKCNHRRPIIALTDSDNRELPKRRYRASFFARKNRFRDLYS